MYRRKPRKYVVHNEVCGVLDRSKRRDRKKGKASVRNVVKEEEHLEISRVLKEEIGMKPYLHGPMDYGQRLKLRFCVGDLDRSERKKSYTSSREEVEEDAQMCPRGKAVESRTHIVEKCEMYKEERDVLAETNKIDNREGLYTR